MEKQFVYVLMAGDWDSEWIDGVYRLRETAEAAADARRKQYTRKRYGNGEWARVDEKELE